MADNELFGISEQLDDTISRAVAIEEVESLADTMSICLSADECRGMRGMKERVLIALNEMPSAQQWIPCSERLPEDYTDVLVWFEYYRYGDYNCLYQMHGIGNYMAEYDSWMINHETGWRELRVFAWMPLPAPWKGERDG